MSNLAAEIAHSKNISQHAECTWNWTTEAGKLRAQRRAELLVSAAGICSTDKVLELGCGTGVFTQKIFNLTKAYITAVDISPELIDLAKSKNIPASFLLDDAMNLKFPDESFDVVFGSSVLHHLKMGKALNEIFRVLKKGGRMVFAEPNMLNPQIFLQKNITFLKKHSGDSPDETAILRWRQSNQLITAGFKSIKIFPYDFLHPHTPVNLISFVNSIGSILEKLPFLKEIAGSVIIFGKK